MAILVQSVGLAKAEARCDPEVGMRAVDARINHGDNDARLGHGHITLHVR